MKVTSDLMCINLNTNKDNLFEHMQNDNEHVAVDKKWAMRRERENNCTFDPIRISVNLMHRNSDFSPYLCVFQLGICYNQTWYARQNRKTVVKIVVQPKRKHNTCQNYVSPTILLYHQKGHLNMKGCVCVVFINVGRNNCFSWYRINEYAISSAQW